MSAESEYDKLTQALEAPFGATAGQMFGKKCVKVGGKAAVALFEKCLVFKLDGKDHARALALKGSILWDPSGKGRPMKQWVQVPVAHKAQFISLGKAAAKFVG